MLELLFILILIWILTLIVILSGFALGFYIIGYLSNKTIKDFDKNE